MFTNTSYTTISESWKSALAKASLASGLTLGGVGCATNKVASNPSLKNKVVQTVVKSNPKKSGMTFRMVDKSTPSKIVKKSFVSPLEYTGSSYGLGEVPVNRTNPLNYKGRGSALDYRGSGYGLGEIPNTRSSVFGL